MDKDSEHTYSEQISELQDFTLGEDGLLKFHDDSPLRPSNWSFGKKLKHTLLYGLVTFCAQFNSTTFSSERFAELMKEQFGISREVAMLSSSFYLLGIAFGPMVFAPISEVYGRKIGVLIPFMLSAVFAFAVATSYNVPSIMVYRFLSGFFCGAPIVSSGGVLADMYSDPSIRGKYLGVYALFVNMGPSTGPVISSLLMYSRPSTDLSAWRIPPYFTGLITLTLFITCELFLDETYQPVVLQRRARQLRLTTGQYKIHCAHDMWKLEFRDVVRDHLVRPFRMLFTPIVFVIVMFAAYVFGVFYIFATTIPVVMKMAKGWDGTVGTLLNIPLLFGTLVGCILNMLYAKRFQRTIIANHGIVIPEERFPLVMLVGWTMPAGIFVFAWTARDHIHWIVPAIGVFLLGIGFVNIFQGCLNYLVDTYTRYAASAIAANTFLRSIFAAAFPLFSKQMFDSLGVQWGGSLIGFIALGMIPIPFVFYKYGAGIRTRRPYIDH